MTQRHNTTIKIAIIGIIIISLFGYIAYIRLEQNKTKENNPKEKLSPIVTLIKAKELEKNGDSSLHALGTIVAKNDAKLQFKIPGQITNIYVKTGDYVKAGTLIAEIDNSMQQAQVTQALGMLETANAQAKSAKAQLKKMLRGTREEELQILEANLADSNITKNNAETLAKNALLSAYAIINQNIIHGTDRLFRNASKYNPKLDFILADSDLRDELSARRVDIRYILNRHKKILSLTNEDLDIKSEIQTVISELQQIKRFYDKLLLAIDKAILPKELENEYANMVVSARAQILQQINLLTNSLNTIEHTENALIIAKTNLQQAKNGARSEDIKTSEAQLNMAEASILTALGKYQSALSALEKTRIRAPISGTLAYLNADIGDFVGTQTIGKIIGDKAKEIIFYIPDTDMSRININDTIITQNGVRGRVTSITKSADNSRKHIEVKAILNTDTNLPDGATVNITIKNNKKVRNNSETSNKDYILAPLNAIKFDTDKTVMFTVIEEDNKNILKAIPVTLGQVYGNMIQVYNISPDLRVVTDVRGLRENQTVQIKDNAQSTSSETEK